MRDIKVQEPLEQNTTEEHSEHIDSRTIRPIPQRRFWSNAYSIERPSAFRTLIALLVIGIAGYFIYFYYYGNRSLSQDLSLLNDSSKETATTTAVKTAFLVNKRLADSSLSVTTNNSVVMLTGEVESLDDKVLAGEVARSTRGVQDVINNITITPNKNEELKELNAENKDLKAESAMFGALLSNKELDSQQIKVKVDNQILILDGYVSSQEQKDLVIKMGSAIPGIQEVKSEKLVVMPVSSK